MLGQVPVAVIGVGASVGLAGLAVATADRDKEARGALVLVTGLALTSIAVYIAKCYEKTTLDLGGGDSMTLYKRTRKIQITDRPNFSNAQLGQFKDFPNLEYLVIEDCPKITEDGLLSLLDCQRLWALDVDCPIPQAIHDLMDLNCVK